MTLLLLIACTSKPVDDTADSSDTSATGDCPAADLFPTVTANAANADYPDPSVQVACDGDELVVTSNDIPWFAYEALTPNELTAMNYEWRIPLEPVEAAEPIALDLLGDDAFALVGLAINTPNEAAEPEPYGDPVYNEIVDACYGHTGGDGSYHMHAIDVECASMVAPTAGAPSPLVGFALDGYPVYGPDACVDAACTEVVTMQSGWVQTGDPTTYAWDAYAYEDTGDDDVLDQCNGRVEPDGSYAYHATATFPYVIGCYHGEVTTGGGGQDTGGPPDSGGPPDTGMPPVIDCADAEPGLPCCGDDVCDGPEDADNCPEDCA